MASYKKFKQDTGHDTADRFSRGFRCYAQQNVCNFICLFYSISRSYTYYTI